MRRRARDRAFYIRLSKTIAHALRHAPWVYGLVPDEEGWVSSEALLQALRRRPEWQDIGEADLHEMLARADKQRFEWRAGRIRALYGHSLPGRISRPVARPPAVLFHGTSPAAVRRIVQEGLRPMGRQYVHLAVTRVLAWQVGRRKAPIPVILRVQAGEAYRQGVRFYRGSREVWLADAIPPAFIEVEESSSG